MFSGRPSVSASVRPGVRPVGMMWAFLIVIQGGCG